jgi:hypothetical protein
MLTEADRFLTGVWGIQDSFFLGRNIDPRVPNDTLLYIASKPLGSG